MTATVKPCPPQIKVCGLTDPDQARACAELGADAIGFVFFPKSPRHLTRKQAQEISKALPVETCRVGVMVNKTYDEIISLADDVNLHAVQLHGQEPPDLANRLQQTGLYVIKALFVDGTPGLQTATDYSVSAFLVECAKGPLPGGNAMAWDWRAARPFGERHPLVLAGGLGPANVADAIEAARPQAVDASSALESAPGQKDIKRVKQFIDNVHQAPCDGINPRRIFSCPTSNNP